MGRESRGLDRSRPFAAWGSVFAPVTPSKAAMTRSSKLAALFHGDDGVVERRGLGIIGDGLDFGLLLRYARLDCRLVIFILDFVERRCLKRERTGRIKRVGWAEVGSCGGQCRVREAGAMALAPIRVLINNSLIFRCEIQQVSSWLLGFPFHLIVTAVFRHRAEAGYNCAHAWRSRPAPNSVLTKSLRRWVPGAWARFIAPTTRVSIAT